MTMELDFYKIYLCQWKTGSKGSCWIWNS